MLQRQACYNPASVPGYLSMPCNRVRAARHTGFFRRRTPRFGGMSRPARPGNTLPACPETHRTAPRHGPARSIIHRVLHTLFLKTYAALGAAAKENRLAKEELIEFGGVVSEALPDNRYRVTLENGVEIWAYASGKMQKHRIRILAGDRVTLEMSPYDLTKGRINFRHKS